MKDDLGRAMRIADSKDFVARKYGPSLLHIIIVCLSISLAAVIMTLTIYDRLALSAILFILAGGAVWYVTGQIRYNREMLQATEFQNALFASALGAHHKFCMIVRNDKSIIYFDRSFQQEFPEFMRKASRDLQAWLDHAQGAKDDGLKIIQAVEGMDDATVECQLKTATGQPQKIKLIVEPILRPSGFMLVRGSVA